MIHKTMPFVSASGRRYEISLKWEADIWEARIPMYFPGHVTEKEDVWADDYDGQYVAGRANNEIMACQLAVAQAKNMADMYHLPVGDHEAKAFKCKRCHRIFIKVAPKSCDVCGRNHYEDC